MTTIKRNIIAAVGALVFGASTLMLGGTANAASSENCGGNLGGSSCGVTFKIYGGSSGKMGYRTPNGGTSYGVSCSGPDTSWCSLETARVYASSVTWTLNLDYGKGCITGYYKGYNYTPTGTC